MVVSRFGLGMEPAAEKSSLSHTSSARPWCMAAGGRSDFPVPHTVFVHLPKCLDISQHPKLHVVTRRLQHLPEAFLPLRIPPSALVPLLPPGPSPGPGAWWHRGRGGGREEEDFVLSSFSGKKLLQFLLKIPACLQSLQLNPKARAKIPSL